LDARELAARRRENAAKKKHARPKAWEQIRRGRKVTANTVRYTILVFCQVNYDKIAFFSLAISFWELANYNK